MEAEAAREKDVASEEFRSEMERLRPELANARKKQSRNGVVANRGSLWQGLGR